MEIGFYLIHGQCIHPDVCHSVRDLIRSSSASPGIHEKSGEPFHWTQEEPGHGIDEPVSDELHQEGRP